MIYLLFIFLPYYLNRDELLQIYYDVSIVNTDHQMQYIIKYYMSTLLSLIHPLLELLLQPLLLRHNITDATRIVFAIRYINYFVKL